MLLASIQSNAQDKKDPKANPEFYTIKPSSPKSGYLSEYQMDSIRKGMNFISQTPFSFYNGSTWSNTNFKIHIDSVYMQRIIEALEERGYTLVKLPKKQ